MHPRLAYGFASSLLRNKLRGEPQPLQCNLQLTYRCNLNCPYCDYHNLRVKEMPPHKWLAVIDQLSDLGCRRVNLTGGEPLLYQGINGLISRIREQGMACVVNSNGVLAEERIYELAGINALVLSLDGLETVNDRVRGPGVWKAVTRALAAARSLGIQVKVNSVITKDSLDGLPDLIRFSRQKRLPLTVNPVEMGNRCQDSTTADLILSSGKIKKVLLYLASNSRNNPWLLFSPRTYYQAACWQDYQIPYLEEEQLNQRHPGWRPPCLAGRFFFCISADGKVFPCTQRNDMAEGGSVAFQGVEGLWRGMWGHTCSACFSPCRLEQNYLYSGNIPVLWNFVFKHLPRVS